VRSLAPPHASDLTFLSVPSAFGHPALDLRGRIVYRSIVRGPAPARPNLAPIVRGDFDTRTVDTIAWVTSQTADGMEVTKTMDPTTGEMATVIRTTLNPFARSDEWAMLSDGTLAIVRVQDYHIDWIDPDGTTRSTPKMAIDWRRYTDAERRQLIDSARQVADDRMRKAFSGRSGAPPVKIEVNMTPESQYPDFWPPVAPGSVLADRDGHLWILPTTSRNAANGFTYDVVNRRGEVIERVQVPKGRVIVGFGPHNRVYMTTAEGPATYLETAVLARM
jgi:hypothetical protein